MAASAAAQETSSKESVLQGFRDCTDAVLLAREVSPSLQSSPSRVAELCCGRGHTCRVAQQRSSGHCMVSPHNLCGSPRDGPLSALLATTGDCPQQAASAIVEQAMKDFMEHSVGQLEHPPTELIPCLAALFLGDPDLTNSFFLAAVQQKLVETWAAARQAFLRESCLPCHLAQSQHPVPAASGGEGLEVRWETELSMEEVLAATNNLDGSNQIALGGSSRVFWGQLRGHPVAVKRLRGGMATATLGDSKFRQFLTELRVMRRTRHRNLLQLQGVCASASELLLVFDYQHNGSLKRRLHHEPVLTWNQRLCIAHGVASGLQYLHSCSPPIVHRDIKSANVLLDQDLEAQIADFGMAEIGTKSDILRPSAATSVMGTQGYLAPECVRSGPVTPSIDVFAFGVVLLELVTGLVAFDPDRTPQYVSRHAFQLAMDGAFSRLLDPRLRASCDKLEELEIVVMLAILCLHPDPMERPPMDEVVDVLSTMVRGTCTDQPLTAPKPPVLT